MWDTLLTGFRIPEIHAIISGNRYDIIDGKQRLTTIFKILNDEIPFYSNGADKSIGEDIRDKGKIKFSDLPEVYQIKIKNTELSIAEYTNLSPDSEDYAILFRKINSGQPLSEIAKGMSRNIHIRTHFTNLLLENPTLHTMTLDTETLELALIRHMCLIKYGDSKDLDTSQIPYEDFTTMELTKYCGYIDNLLNDIEDLSFFNTNRSKATGLSHLLWDLGRFDLTTDQKKKYIELFSNRYSSGLTTNRNFNRNRIRFFKNFSENLLAEIQ